MCLLTAELLPVFLLLMSRKEPSDQQLSVLSAADSDHTPGAFCVCETHHAGWDLQGGTDPERSPNKKGHLHGAQ